MGVELAALCRALRRQAVVPVGANPQLEPFSVEAALVTQHQIGFERLVQVVGTAGGCLAEQQLQTLRDTRQQAFVEQALVGLARSGIELGPLEQTKSVGQRRVQTFKIRAAGQRMRLVQQREQGHQIALAAVRRQCCNLFSQGLGLGVHFAHVAQVMAVTDPR